MSVERIMEYSKLELEQQPAKSDKLPTSWPRNAKIEFKKVVYRHFDVAEPVLRELSFIVQPKEKIGILDRVSS